MKTKILAGVIAAALALLARGHRAGGLVLGRVRHVWRVRHRRRGAAGLTGRGRHQGVRDLHTWNLGPIATIVNK